MLVLLEGSSDVDHLSAPIFAARGHYANKRELLEQFVEQAEEEAIQADTQLLPVSRHFIDYMATSKTLRDGDKLAFVDLVEELLEIEELRGISNHALMPLTMAKAEIEAALELYRKDYAKALAKFGSRGTHKGESWDSYLAHLRSIYTYDDLLLQALEGNTPLHREANRGAAKASTKKDQLTSSKPKLLWGNGLPDKTVVLTFDDGPHRSRTGKILDILKQHQVQAYFFSVGKNLGKIDKDGKTRLKRKQTVVKRIVDEGHVLANHSYSHSILTKLEETGRSKELSDTNQLITAVTGSPNVLFRPPYGSKDKALEDLAHKQGLISVMWNLDSMDWADSIPESIADRTLRRLDETQKGILLFHDIHRQTVEALPDILKGLNKRGYRVVALNGQPFNKKQSGIPQVPKSTKEENIYGQSWAVVIGINDYQHWPNLKYATNDARSIAETLHSKLGFPKENIIELYDKDASRERITEVLGYKLADPKKIKPEDRVFIFYAGHGATRTLPNKKNLGYLIPADAELSKFQNRAISMSQINDFSSLIPAKHVYFVMDSCYSGLALTRSGMSSGQALNYVQQITDRRARQILTAGGADQEVADGGPGGHSVFTWILLQALEGLADTDNNGYITASEIGTYVAPVVASYADQTPAFGNLVGSQGGDFVFKIDNKAMAAIQQKMAAENKRIEEEINSLRNNTQSNMKRRLELELALNEARNGKKAVSTASDPKQAETEDKDSKKDRIKQARRLDASALGYYKEKKYALAEEEWREAVRLNPYNPTIVNNLGFILDKQNKNKEALKWYYRTVELDARRTSVYLNLGDIMVKLKRNQEAIPYYERYLHLYPSYDKAKELREKIKALQDGTYIKD